MPDVMPHGTKYNRLMCIWLRCKNSYIPSRLAALLMNIVISVTIFSTGPRAFSGGGCVVFSESRAPSVRPIIPTGEK